MMEDPQRQHDIEAAETSDRNLVDVAIDETPPVPVLLLRRLDIGPVPVESLVVDGRKIGEDLGGATADVEQPVPRLRSDVFLGQHFPRPGSADEEYIRAKPGDRLLD